jgi:hypothetical protein
MQYLLRNFALWMFSVLLLSAPGYSTLPDFFPVEDLRPGMKGVVYTVMQGSEVVPVEAEILGVLEGGLGPRRDMIIGKLVDEKTKLTGAVHGMSGSPLMIDGKLVGALSRRLGTFEKDGHCGFTPAKDMWDVSRRGHDDTQAASQVTQNVFNPSAAPGAGVAADAALLSVPLTVSGGANSWNLLSDRMQQWFPGSIPVTATGTRVGNGDKKLPPIKAGSPLAVILMDGDITMAVTGTTTWVDGDQVVGFGHPMFGTGPVEFPIAPAEIISVLPSYYRPYKIANAGVINGTLDQDRHSAVSGRVGPIPEMATYRITRKHNHELRPEWQGRMVKHHLLAPRLITVLAANAMMDAQDYSGDFTMTAKTSVKFKGFEEFATQGIFSGSEMERMIGIFDQITPLLTVMARYDRQLEVESVRFDVETIEVGSRWELLSLDSEQDEVEVGETLKLIIRLKNTQGQERTLRTTWSPPEELRGKRIRLECISGLNLNFMRQQSNKVVAGRGPADALRYLKPRFLQDHLYIRGTESGPALLKAGQMQAGLPHAVRSVASENPAPETVSTYDKVVYGEQSLPVAGMVEGIETTMIQVK